MANQGRIVLGTQGFGYKDWVGPFYPAGTSASDYLARYSQIFDAVELDTTFYGPPRPEAVTSWFESTPEHFEFTAKMPRVITHDRRLVAAEADLVEFLTAMSELKQKLGPILIQLPPSFTIEESEALRTFLAILPEEFRYAVELRDRSWLDSAVDELLSQHNIARTLIDLHYMPRTVGVTTDFTYMRWLGNRQDIEKLDQIQIDRSEDIAHWAAEIDRIAQKVQRVYGFFNNHYAGHSPASVNEMKRTLGLPVREPASGFTQGTLPLGV